MWPIAKRALVIGALCLVGASASAYAGSHIPEAKIPFPFMVGSRTLPAGQYTIERDDDMSGALIIRGEHGVNASAVLNTRPADSSPTDTHAALQFRRVENEYRLANVRTGDGLDLSVVAH